MLGLAIPLYDEVESAAAAAQGVAAALRRAGVPYRLALVDNGSSDGTGRVLEELAAGDPELLVVSLAKNAGYGGGVLAGLAALRALDPAPDVLGWCWGDGQITPDVIPELYRACQRGVPLAKARRVVRQDGWRRQATTAAYAAILRQMGAQTPDVNGCPKLLRREALDALALRSTDWFLDAEAVLKAEERGWEIADAAVVMQPRQAGASKVRLGALAQFAGNLWRWRRGWRP